MFLKRPIVESVDVRLTKCVDKLLQSDDPAPMKNIYGVDNKA